MWGRESREENDTNEWSKKKKEKRGSEKSEEREGDKSENGKRQSWKRWNESGENRDAEMERRDVETVTGWAVGPRPVSLSVCVPLGLCQGPSRVRRGAGFHGGGSKAPFVWFVNTRVLNHLVLRIPLFFFFNWIPVYEVGPAEAQWQLSSFNLVLFVIPNIGFCQD